MHRYELKLFVSTDDAAGLLRLIEDLFSLGAERGLDGAWWSEMAGDDGAGRIPSDGSADGRARSFA